MLTLTAWKVMTMVQVQVENLIRRTEQGLCALSIHID